MLNFDWRADKENDNKSKHGLDFSFAELVFKDPFLLIVYDRFENNEHRWHAIGFVGSTCLIVVHTEDDPGSGNIRVISLRKATSHERRRYEEHDEDG